jgi:hypothetical protein
MAYAFFLFHVIVQNRMTLKVFVKPNLNVLTLSHAWQHPSFEPYRKKGHFSLFLLEVLSRDALPAFTYRGRKHPLQKPEAWYGNFARDVKAHYMRHQKDIRKGLRYGRIPEAKGFPHVLGKLVKSFGPYRLSCREAVLCPNVFGVAGEGYGPLIGKTAYAIFKPNPKKDQTWLMVHEVCHSLLLPTFQSKKVRRLIQETKPAFEKWTTKKFRTYYPKWDWAIEEYLIHAIEHRVTGSSLKDKRAWGMNRIDWFVKSWGDFQDKKDRRSTVEDWIILVLRELKSKVEK